MSARFSGARCAKRAAVPEASSAVLPAALQGRPRPRRARRLGTLVALWLAALLAPALVAAGQVAAPDEGTASDQGTASDEGADTLQLAGPDEAELAVPMHEAIYHASVSGIPVRAGMRLQRQEGRYYLFESWVEPRGLLSFISRELSEQSLLTLDTRNRVIPISYRKRDEFGGRDSDIRFEPLEGEMRIRFRGDETTREWSPGTYDLLSLRLALAHDMARGSLADVYGVVDDRSRVEQVDVQVAGRETLSTELGELETVRLEYRSERRDRLFRLWLAPGMDMALVQLEQYEEGRLRGRLKIVEYRRL